MIKAITSRSLVAALIATMVVIAPLPLSVGSASAAAGPSVCCTYSLGEISFIFDYLLDTTKPPDLSLFDVTVDGVANPVTAIRYLNTIVYLTLTSTVYKPSVIALSYNAPASVNGLSNNALQTATTGLDVISFVNPNVTNLGGTNPQPNTPGVPTVVVGEESATITVTPATGGRTPTSYLVTASPSGATCTVTGAEGSCTVTGLTAGTVYTFTTVAKWSVYNSVASAASTSVTVLPKITAPNTPGVPTVVVGEESATITVTAPTGTPIPTSYEVTATPNGATCTVTGASGACTITGLRAGTAYTFTTVAKISTGNSPASTASASVTVLPKTSAPTDTVPAGYTPSWDKEPLTDSETDANTVGYMPTTAPGKIIITDEFGFMLDNKNGIKPNLRMKNYAGKIKMTISAKYKDGAKTKNYKCAFAPFGSTKTAKTAKWKWYTPKKACILPAPLVAAIRANTATLSANGTWTRQWLTTGKKVRADKTKIKARKMKYTVKAKPAGI
jgi:hypothetical protein